MNIVSMQRAIRQGHPQRRTVLFLRPCLLLLLLCLLLISSPLPASAITTVPEAPGLPDMSRASSVILYNTDFGVSLAEKDADVVVYPASTVKIMTGLLAAELLGERMGETVTVTSEMVSGVAGNSMKLEAGERVSVEALYYGAICGGYNDACTALAVTAAGSVDAFVEIMNAKAALLEMTATVYQNPTGMHTASMVTTARDTLRLSVVAAENETFMTAASTVLYTVPATNKSASRTFYNRNSLISSSLTTEYYNSYARGLNAGMTSEGGYCLSTKITARNGLSYICVVLGGDEDEYGTIHSYTIANDLVTWAARGYESREIVAGGRIYGYAEAAYAAIGEVPAEGVALLAAESVSALLPVGVLDSDLKYSVRLHGASLEAPFSAGDEAGFLVVTYNGEEVGHARLVTEIGATRSGFVWMLESAKNLWTSRAFIAFLISFAVLLALYIRFFCLKRARMTLKRRGRRHSPILPFLPRNARTKPPAKAPEKPPIPPQSEDPYAEALRELSRREKK